MRNPLYRTEVCDEVVSYITSQKDTWDWEDDSLVPVDDIPLKVAKDPMLLSQDPATPNAGIFLCPYVIEFGENSTAAQRQGTRKNPLVTVSLVVSQQLTNSPSREEEYDLVAQIEWQRLSDLKDDLDYLVSQMPVSNNIEIQSLEPQQSDQIEYGALWYVEWSLLSFMRKC